MDYINDGIQLLVNNTEIGLNKFASNFIKDSLWGMIDALNTAEYDTGSFEEAIIELMKINPNQMRKTEIALSINNISIGINDFVSGIMKESIYGMVNSLNMKEFGVKKIENIYIKIKK